MQQSANLQLPYIMPSQAQKHVTHNEAIRTLDAVVQLAVDARHLSAPPATPADGNRFLIAAAPSGAWTGKEGQIAAWQDGAWAYLIPNAGWLAWVVDEERLISFDGAGWADAAVHSVNPVAMVGVNTTADTSNRFAVKSADTLFDQETGNHRMKINKAASGDTASVVFQSGYSGRAEFGLTGDDDWHVKVSADGAVWSEALKVDRDSGRVRLPTALALSDENQVVTRRHIRDQLTANRTYYVRTDGSDSNGGLANNSAGAYLTLAKAFSAVLALDLSIYNVTIQLQDTTWSEGVSLSSPWVGAGTVTLRGTTNACVISSAVAISVANLGTKLTLSNLTIAGSNIGIVAQNGGAVSVGGNVIFSGSPTGAHVRTNGPGSTVVFSAAYSILSGGARHYWASPGGYINAFGLAVTLTGTLAFSITFAQADRGALISTSASTFSGGTVTGKRYDVATNAVLFTGGGGASHYPGDVAGTAATGGQYA